MLHVVKQTKETFQSLKADLVAERDRNEGHFYIILILVNRQYGQEQVFISTLKIALVIY